MWLGSGVAGAQTHSCSLDQTPSPLPCAAGAALKRPKKKKKENKAKAHREIVLNLSFQNIKTRTKKATGAQI